jgi:hypothetical protein
LPRMPYSVVQIQRCTESDSIMDAQERGDQIVTLLGEIRDLLKNQRKSVGNGSYESARTQPRRNAGEATDKQRKAVWAITMDLTHDKSKAKAMADDPNLTFEIASKYITSKGKGKDNGYRSDVNEESEAETVQF